MIEARDGTERAEVPTPTRSRSLSLAGPIAGPALIVAAVLLLLRDVAFGGMVTDQHIDLLSFWLPTHCLLGSSLAAGVVPAWNPHVMAGLPFAADPQSGWMYLPAMALHGLLPCGAAFRLFIVLQPILAGLGISWFLRNEGLSRPAATAGGLALALGIAGSTLVISLPIAGSLAWTAILLAAASRLLRAPTWAARLGWATAAAVAWGQLAAAHLSHGLVIGTATLLAYAAVRTTADVRAGARSVRESVLTVTLLVALLIPVNLAFLLPRIGYVPEASLGLGYEGMERLAARLSGTAPVPLEVGPAAGPSWPMRFATSPGAYLGAVVLLLSFAGWWSRRHRPLTAAFAGLGLLFYLASLEPVARAVAPLARSLPLGDFYLHEPLRFRSGLLLVLPVLGALGVEAWRFAPEARARLRMLLPGLVVWAGLPLLLPVGLDRLLLPALAATAGIAALAVVARRPGLALVLPALLAAELVANGLLGQGAGEEVGAEAEVLGAGWGVPFVNLLRPKLPSDEYLREGRIVETLHSSPGRERFLTVPPTPRRFRISGYLSYWDPRDRGLLNNQRAMLFGLEDAQGYNPVQPRPYWMFVRYGRPPGLRHNRAVLRNPSAAELDLLHVGWINAAADAPPMEGAALVVREGRWGLYRRPAPARATLLTRWRVERDQVRALGLVADEGFDPSELVILDRDPGPGAPEGGEGAGGARYEQLGPQEVRVAVTTPRPAVLLVRNTYDRNWRATVDGRPAAVYRANSFLQAVAVPAGESVVRLRFHDPNLGRGLAGSGAVLLLAAGGAVALRLRERRRAAPSPEDRSAGPG